MNQLELKNKLLEVCLTEIDERAEALRKEMEDAQQSANDYGQPKDRYDSYRTQLLRKRDMFGQQLQKILEQRHMLGKVDGDKQYKKVEFGAMVTTNKQVILVCIGLGKVEFEGDEYFVVSPVVPFYKAMDTMKKGDSFEFRGQKFEILDIC